MPNLALFTQAIPYGEMVQVLSKESKMATFT
jgi:hypothetical protein